MRLGDYLECINRMRFCIQLENLAVQIRVNKALNKLRRNIYVLAIICCF